MRSTDLLVLISTMSSLLLALSWSRLRFWENQKPRLRVPLWNSPSSGVLESSLVSVRYSSMITRLRSVAYLPSMIWVK